MPITDWNRPSCSAVRGWNGKDFCAGQPDLSQTTKFCCGDQSARRSEQSEIAQAIAIDVSLADLFIREVGVLDLLVKREREYTYIRPAPLRFLFEWPMTLRFDVALSLLFSSFFPFSFAKSKIDPPARKHGCGPAVAATSQSPPQVLNCKSANGTMTDTAEEKSPKRRRLDGETDTTKPNDIKGDRISKLKDAGSSGLPHLPPDLWALVMPFMPFTDNLTCSILNRSFLKDVAPRIKEIAVLNRGEMRVGKLTTRFSGVEDVTIACLFCNPGGFEEPYHHDDYSFEFARLDDVKRWEHLCPEVDNVVVSRTLPFLLAFPSLSQAYFGRFYMIETKFRGNVFSYISPYDGKSYPRWHSELIQWVHPVFAMSSLLIKSDESQRNCQLIQSLEMNLAGAYASGLWSDDVHVSMFPKNCFSDVTEPRDEPCPHCSLCNNAFPFYNVVRAAPDRCTSADSVVQSILKRKGGREYLTSEEFIFEDYVNTLIYSRVQGKEWSLAEAFTRAGLCASFTRSKLVNWLTIEDGSRLLGDRQIRNDLIALGVPIQERDWNM